jgi:succinoglycan biosynthesis transport protein ExoP
MLHNHKMSPLLNSTQQEQGWETSGPGPADLALGFLRRHVLAILVTTALSLAASVAFLKFAPPTYTAEAKVLIGSSKAPAVQPQTVMDDTPVDIESQIEILKSRTIATSVINQLHLADDPEFNGKGGRYHLALTAIREKLGIPQQALKSDPMDELVEDFQSRMWADRVGMSSVIDIGFNYSNAQRAAEITNTIARAYIDDQLKARDDSRRAATTWLQSRMLELSNDARTAERSVHDLKTSSNVVSADGKLMDEQQVADLNTRLVAARTRTAEAAARLTRYEAILASNNAEAASMKNLDAISIGNVESGESLSISDPQNNQIINNLRQQYLDFARREYEYASKLGNDHLVVVNLRTTMKSIRLAIFDEVRRLAEISRSDFAVAKERQAEMEKQLAEAVSLSRTTNSAELSIKELDTSAKGYRSLYESFLQRYMGSVQQGSFPATEARVISPATPPQKKGKPNTKMVLVLGLFGGIALGTAFGFAREMKDRGFRTTAQIEQRLRMPCLSVVPLLNGRKVKKVIKRSASTAVQVTEPSQRTISRGSGTCWAASAMPTSRFAESIRSIRFAIDLDPTKTPSKVVGLTSTLPNEGKSTVAASLAQLLAKSGKRVIVVDGDLRNPSLSDDFTPDAGAGITDVLSGARTLEETIWKDTETGLHFLPGKRGPLVNSSEILCTDEAKALFNELRATYDYVIVDLPPLAPIVDVRATSALVDSFILVVEWGQTTSDVIEHALNNAPNVYDSLLGVVLNKADMKAMKRYANHIGDYYNDQHYLQYGQLAAE